VAEAIDQFRDAMAEAGIPCDGEIIADGKLHRYRGPGDDAGTKDGFYVLHLDAVAAGSFGHWRIHPDAIKWHVEGGADFDPKQGAAITKQIAAAKATREKELAEQHANAAEQARAVWAEAHDADADHPYLVAKRVGTHGLKEAKGRLLVPVYIDGALASLQSIDEKGEKKFARGGKVAGGSYRIGGKPGDLIYLVEGFATGASIYEAIEGASPVVVAFSAGNLLAVAQALRKKYRKAAIVIAADNDQATEGNPGIAWARKAAEAVRAQVAIASLKADPSAKCDFNDVARIDGAEVVRAALDEARGLLGVSAASIVVIPTKWEWWHRFPSGEVIMIDSDPNLGKTTLVTDLAARKSRGLAWPDGELCEAGNVIIVSAEDSSNTLVGRLTAHDADLSRIRIVSGNFQRDGATQVLTLPEHAGELEKIIRADKARLMFIDPLTGIISEKVDSHRDSSVRRVMGVISHLAQSTGCTIICIRHLTKQAAIENALYRGGGSIAIIAAARAGFILGFDPNDKAPVAERARIFAHLKYNLGPQTPSLAFRIRAGEGESFAHVEWIEGGSPLTPNELLLAPAKPRNADALDRAVDFLKLELAPGQRRSTELEAAADAAGISKSTFERARKTLKTVSFRTEGIWYTSLKNSNSSKEI
jgi:putative DNA primase/helicase